MRNRPPVVLYLRSSQTEYLEYLAERDAGPVSEALDWLIRDRMRTPQLVVVNPARKARRSYTLAQDCLDYVDKLGGLWGLGRSDVVRRIVDDAQLKDETI